MSEMIGYCGYRCHLCAARSDDPIVRQQLVDGWRKYFGHQNYTVDNVRCDGCLSDGRLADKSCKARPCAMEKGVKSCVDCAEFPCDKMKHLMASREGMLVFCYPRTAAITEQEYNLCMHQFDSMSGLLNSLSASGKMSSWIAHDGERQERQ